MAVDEPERQIAESTSGTFRPSLRASTAIRILNSLFLNLSSTSALKSLDCLEW